MCCQACACRRHVSGGEGRRSTACQLARRTAAGPSHVSTQVLQGPCSVLSCCWLSSGRLQYVVHTMYPAWRALRKGLSWSDIWLESQPSATVAALQHLLPSPLNAAEDIDQSFVFVTCCARCSAGASQRRHEALLLAQAVSRQLLSFQALFTASNSGVRSCRGDQACQFQTQHHGKVLLQLQQAAVVGSGPLPHEQHPGC